MGCGCSRKDDVVADSVLALQSSQKKDGPMFSQCAEGGRGIGSDKNNDQQPQQASAAENEYVSREQAPIHDENEELEQINKENLAAVIQSEQAGGIATSIIATVRRP